MSNTKEQTEVLVKSLTGDDVADLIGKSLELTRAQPYHQQLTFLLGQLLLLQDMLRSK